MAEKPAPETNTQSLEQLRAALPERSGIDPTIAIIASTDPETLSNAVADQQLKQFKAHRGAQGHPAVERHIEEATTELRGYLDEQSVNHIFESTEAGAVQSDMAAAYYRDDAAPTVEQLEALFSTPDSNQKPEESSTAKSIQELEENAQKIRDEAESHAREAEANRKMTDFADDIERKQRKLSFPARALGTIACGIAMSSAGGITSYELFQTFSQRDMITAAAAGSGGIIGTVMSGAIFSREGVIAKIAHRRAKRKLQG